MAVLAIGHEADHYHTRLRGLRRRIEAVGIGRLDLDALALRNHVERGVASERPTPGNGDGLEVEPNVGADEIVDRDRRNAIVAARVERRGQGGLLGLVALVQNVGMEKTHELFAAIVGRLAIGHRLLCAGGEVQVALTVFLASLLCLDTRCEKHRVEELQLVYLFIALLQLRAPRAACVRLPKAASGRQP